MLKRIVRKYIEKEGLFEQRDKLIVALSGGADSVALLRLLTDCGYSVEAAHCNFHLRGEESDRDERFVRELCSKLGLTLHTTHFDTTGYAAEHKLSIEMAARELRYNWFETLRKERGASYIAVAHHRDDSVETILLNLIRGTGISGLTGIHPRNGYVVRPLLCISRSDITSYLTEIGQDYVTDSTNLADEYTRNKIRLNILPLMEEINPAAKESIARSGESVREALDVYRSAIDQGRQRVLTAEGIKIDALMDEPSPKALLHEVLYPLGFNPRQIADVYASLSGEPGRQFVSADGWRTIKDRNMLLLTRADSPEHVADEVPPQISQKIVEMTADYRLPRSRDVLCCDADKMCGPLQMRHCRKGDRFVPFGMRGSKLLSDYMTDRKFSLAQKEQQWLLCSGDKIVWVVGERSDDRFRVDEHTRRVLEVRITPSQE
jgi:tRNA(Ile)-lysidine synthase